MVVAYKSAHLEEYDKEQRNFGELWEEKSAGKALFLWATKEDDKHRDVYRQVEVKVKVNE